jgi:hypothetical protein
MSTTITAITDVSRRPVFHGLTPVYLPQRNPAKKSITNDTMVEMRRARAKSFRSTRNGMAEGITARVATTA